MGIADAFDERPGGFRKSALMALRICDRFDKIQASLMQSQDLSTAGLDQYDFPASSEHHVFEAARETAQVDQGNDEPTARRVGKSGLIQYRQAPGLGQ